MGSINLFPKFKELIEGMFLRYFIMGIPVRLPGYRHTNDYWKKKAVVELYDRYKNLLHIDAENPDIGPGPDKVLEEKYRIIKTVNR